MSDHNHPHANGRSDPTELPAAELAARWDRRVTDRRSGSTDLPSSEATVAVVAQLDALARADELSAPRPGFLDHLERQIMPTPHAVLPTPIAAHRPEPLPTIPFARPRRRSRGLVDILTVAAVLALLLGGSWSVFNDRANAPTPDGQNGVAGVTTPEASGTTSAGVAIDRPWATNQDDDQIAGMVPVDPDQCQTTARPAGSVEEAIGRVVGQTWSREQLSIALFPSLEYVSASNDLTSLIQRYPQAPDDQRSIAEKVYSQAMACRFDNGKQTSGDLEPYTGAYWNLFGTDYFLDRFNLRLANPVLDVEDVIDQSFGDEPAVGGQGAYPPAVLDVRMLPPSTTGSPRLLVLRQSVIGFATRSLDVLVLEDGLWRFAGQPVVTEVSENALSGFSVDVGIGSGPTGAATIQVTGAQFEADVPVSLTIANRGTEPLAIELDGQALGSIGQGGSVRTTPFEVSNATVDAAGGRLDLALIVRPVGDGLDGSADASTNLQVFPSGGLARRLGYASSTPAADVTPVAANTTGVAILDQPWAENELDLSINGVLPVSTSECATPSRAAGSVEAAVQERQVLGDAAPTIEPEFLAGPRINPDTYSPGTARDAAAMTEFFRQLSACRFETAERNGTQLLPYTGAYWNLFADDSFIFDDWSAPFADHSAEELVREQYSFVSSYVTGWSYPGTVLDVRQAPPDAGGNPRLLVTTEGSSAVEGETTSLMVQEDGQWRVLIADVAPAVYGSPVRTQVVDILLGRDGYGPRSSGNFRSQLEADFPVAMTIANVGQTPQQVIVAGQDLGIVESGEAIVVQPFRVRPDALEAADGFLTFTVESVDQEARPDGPVARPYTIAVYAAGSLPYASDQAAAGTPIPTESAPAATPMAVAATPLSPAVSETPVPVAVAADPDLVVELDQPWAISSGTDVVNGVSPVDVSECTIEARRSGALLALVESSANRPVAEFPHYLLTIETDALFGQYPAGTNADREAALGFFNEWSACRFEVGLADLPLEDRYTAPFYALRSDDNLLRTIPEGEGRTAESLLRQARITEPIRANGPYPDEVLDVRVFPADDRGQPRLLVRHRTVAGTPYDQVSLLVLEDGVWRLAEQPDLLYSPSPTTPGATPPNLRSVMTLNLDIANAGAMAFVDWALSDVPIAVTLTNSGSVPSSVMIGEQDLGMIGPGETIRVVPFTIPTSVLDEGNGGFELTVAFTGADGTEQRHSWTIHSIDDPIWGNLP